MKIYLDNNATTQVTPEVLETMLPYFTEEYGNSTSRNPKGKVVAYAVEEAREKVAHIISSKPSEITFTSGATEAINMALVGYYLANKDKGNHIITVQTEHKSVLDTLVFLETQGARVSYLPVNKFGLINLKELKSAITPSTLMLAVMFANNETGVIQDIKGIGEITAKNNVLFFCDATQAVGKVKVNVETTGIDMLAFSAHKIYGPKGIGSLFIKSKKPKIELQPLVYGGGQEKGLRSGTLNVPAIVGFGKACEIAEKTFIEEYKRQSMMRDRLENKLLMIDSKARLSGGEGLRLPNTINICFHGFEATQIMESCPNLSFSVGSACSSGKPSHVLKAMGKSNKDILGSFRLSIGKFTALEEIEETAKLFKETIFKLKSFRS